MTTKKTIKKPIVIKSTEEYKPVFSTIEIITTKKIDLNWISIRRKIQTINFFKWMKVEKEKTHKEKYGFDIWEIYCNWFNESFNKEELNDDEDYNKIEQTIRGKKYE